MSIINFKFPLIFQILQIIQKLTQSWKMTDQNSKKTGLDAKPGTHFDKQIYGQDRTQFLDTVVDEEITIEKKVERRKFTGSRQLIKEAQMTGSNDDNMLQKRKSKPLSDKYRERGLRKRMLSPTRHDALLEDKTPDVNSRSYREIMRAQRIENQRQALNIQMQRREEELKGNRQSEILQHKKEILTRKSQLTTDNSDWESSKESIKKLGVQNRWDQTPQRNASKYNETPTPGKWAEPTPAWVPNETPRRRSSKWDDKTPIGMTLGGFTPTPNRLGNTPSFQDLTPSQMQVIQWEQEMQHRNQYLTDEELNQILPSDGFEIVEPPEGYKPLQRPGKTYQQTPMNNLYNIPAEAGKPYQVPGTSHDGHDLPSIKQEDIGYFGPLLNAVDEDQLTLQEQRDRKIMMLLLKIKNGTPPMRKSALRQITEKAREFGAGPLFNQILPLLMSPTLEDQERHLLVKVIDRVMYKLDELVRPYVHKILVVIEPLLIDKDYYARVEGREIISNLAKAAGLNTMITTMRPDIDHSDEFVRNTTARSFAVVASALGIPALLPFLRAVCKSKKSWQAKHTGIKIIQQIAILLGCAVLPHLRSLVEIMKHGLKDEQQKVRTITSLALAALAEASTPYGIEAFKSVLIPLWEGIQRHRGKGLAAFLKAIGFIIPLMNSQHASLYTKETMKILKREFKTSEEEMKKIVLKVVKQCVSTEGVTAKFVREEILEEFFQNFWIRQMALDKRNYRQLVDTTVEIAIKVGGADIIDKIVLDLKDENEPYRKMVMETIEKIIITLGVSDIDTQLEGHLMEGILHAFHEQTSDDTIVMLNGFGAVVNCLGLRTKPYFPRIGGLIHWRLNNQSARIRQQAADLITRIALIMKKCDETVSLGSLSLLLYECLGEEYPEVLGSILGGLKAIVNVVGMEKMTPPIKDLLPRLTPILKNRHEKVQENCIDLVGRIADRGDEYVNAKEWMRICFDLLDLLKAHKKGIRRATVNTFGYIAKAIGPQDVLYTLLNNLKVQERQNRVCTTVAIAIVAETCGPFTVLPALMNEYRVPELNVQNGVLKSLSFMFEYIGEMGKDYIYAITPLLEDALTDRDLVHRQTAASAVKHLALGVQGLQCEDALVHLLNYVWPNIFESSPHVIQAVQGAIEGMRVSLGSGNVLLYTLQGLYHPARRVRNVYWKIYNILYIGSQDALNSYYPQLENEPNNDYTRHELSLFI